MNDGSAQRSPLSSYRIAKADDDSEASEKVAMIENSVKPIDAAQAKMPANSKESQEADNIAKLKSDTVSPFPAHGTITGNPNLAKALLGGDNLAEDFDMSMVPMAFPQRVSSTEIRRMLRRIFYERMVILLAVTIHVKILLSPRVFLSLCPFSIHISSMKWLPMRRIPLPSRGFLMARALSLPIKRNSVTGYCQSTLRRVNSLPLRES